MDLKHWSDCAVYNEPAYPAGDCDCGVGGMGRIRYLGHLIRLKVRQLKSRWY